MAATDSSAMQSMDSLTGFQRDLLFTIASLGPAKGLRIKEELQEYYATEINHGRLYPNLDDLVERGFVEKGKIDRRSNSYELSTKGEQTLEQRRAWEAERFDG